jgi:hypothetical protein
VGQHLGTDTLDRYIRGEKVAKAQYEQVWKKLALAISATWYRKVQSTRTSSQPSVISQFKAPCDARIRVFGGDPDQEQRDSAAVTILNAQALQKRGKACHYGAGHFWRAAPKEFGFVDGIVRLLE